MQAFLKQLKKPEKINKVVKLQAFIRGSMIRSRHQEAIHKIKADAPKKTTGYKRLAKL